MINYNLYDILNYNIESSLQGNIPGSAKQYTQDSIIKLINFFNKPTKVNFKVEKHLYELLVNPLAEKIEKKSTIHASLNYVMNTLGYQTFYSKKFVSYALALKVLVTAVNDAFKSGIIVDSRKKFILEKEPNIVNLNELIQKYIDAKNDYINLFLIELIPNDTVSLLVENAEYLEQIDNKELLQLFLTPNIAYLQFTNEILIETYKSVMRASYYTDAIIFLFLFMRYHAITKYIQKYKIIKYPKIKCNYNDLYEYYFKKSVDIQLNKLETFVMTYKKK